MTSAGFVLGWTRAALGSALLLCAAPSTAGPHNVLLIVADDIGLESLSVYPRENAARDWPPTPTLTELASAGMVFDNAWSNPTCSPTRATILTGRYAMRTGVTGLVREHSRIHLPVDEVTIPLALDRIPGLEADSAAFGKWHLANRLNGGPHHPNVAGFSHFAGALDNFKEPDDYFAWPRTVDGRTERVEFDPANPRASYVTTINVNDTLAWIGSRDPDRSWFVYLAFHAAHHPWRMPPENLLDTETTMRLTAEAGDRAPAPRSVRGTSKASRRRATIAAMDHEIGRLFAGLEAIAPKLRSRTTVIFVGDNGTKTVVRPDGSPYPDHSGKFSLFQGGINVPLIVNGPAVAEPGRSDALVHTSDLFATTVELIGGKPIEKVLPDVTLDSVSLLPVLAGSKEPHREFVFTSNGRDAFAIRNRRFKLIRLPGNRLFYDLEVDPYEERNLGPGPFDDATRSANYAALDHALGKLLEPMLDACPLLAECGGTRPDSSPDAPSPASTSADAGSCAYTEIGSNDCRLRNGKRFTCDEGTVQLEKCACAGAPDHSFRLVCR
jgi:arylsulfatase A-like enzyme